MRILLVDAAGTPRATTANWLEMVRGVSFVEVTTSGREALALLANGTLPPQLVLVDAQLADMNVFDFIREVKAHAVAPKVVLIAALLSVRLTLAGRAAGADHSIEKIRLQRELPQLLIA